jgi:hypothetical protein
MIKEARHSEEGNHFALVYENVGKSDVRAHVMKARAIYVMQRFYRTNVPSSSR